MNQTVVSGRHVHENAASVVRCGKLFPIRQSTNSRVKGSFTGRWHQSETDIGMIQAIPEFRSKR